MSDHPEAALAITEPHAREFEACVTHQVALIEEMEKDNHPAAVSAQEVLATLQHSLELAREHLRIEQDIDRRGNTAGASSG